MSKSAKTIASLQSDDFAFEQFVQIWASENYPSISVPALNDEQPVLNTVESVGAGIQGGIQGNARKYLDKLQTPAMIMDVCGHILDANAAASEIFQISRNEKTISIDFNLMSSEPLEDAIGKAVSGDARHGQVVLRQAYIEQCDRPVSIAICTLNRKAALIMLLDRTDRESLHPTIVKSFRLSNAEIEILERLMGGLNLQEIAEVRGRSFATVKTQMHRICQKFNVSRQIDLVRAVAKIERNLDALNQVKQEEMQGNQRHTFLRPNGRKVDVSVSGHPNGPTVLFIPGNFLHFLPSWLERSFTRAGLTIISVRRPGYGRTSLSERQNIDSFPEDALAVMDQLGCEKFSILAHSTGIPPAFHLCAQAPERVLGMTVVGLYPPRRFVEKQKTSSNWHDAIVTACLSSAKLTKFLTLSGRRYMSAIGTRAFLKRYYKSSPDDLKIMLTDEMVEIFERSVKCSEEQGIDASTDDAIACTENWDFDLNSVSSPVTILHGKSDPLCPIEAVRSFYREYPFMELIEIEGGHSACLDKNNKLSDLLGQLHTR